MPGRGVSRSVVVAVCVAAVVLIAALTGAYLLRQRTSGGPAGPQPTVPAGPTAQLQCDQGPCRTIATASVAGDTVELLTDPSGTGGRVRITGPNVYTVFETTITHLGATLTPHSLSCLAAATPACMVSGTGDDGSVSEVFVDRSGDWKRTQDPYYASGGYVALYQPPNAAAPEIVSVQNQCPDTDAPSACARTQLFAEVFSLTGDEVGCTHPVSRESELPGWPSVTPASGQLHPCP